MFHVIIHFTGSGDNYCSFKFDKEEYEDFITWLQVTSNLLFTTTQSNGTYYINKRSIAYVRECKKE